MMKIFNAHEAARTIRSYGLRVRFHPTRHVYLLERGPGKAREVIATAKTLCGIWFLINA